MADTPRDGQQDAPPAGGLQVTARPDKHVFKAPEPRQSLLGEWGERPDRGQGCRWATRLPHRPRRRRRQSLPPLAAAACSSTLLLLPSLAAGLDRLAAQKRAEQAKAGTVLGV